MRHLLSKILACLLQIVPMKMSRYARIHLINSTRAVKINAYENAANNEYLYSLIEKKAFVVASSGLPDIYFKALYLMLMLRMLIER